jgi:hypothetical protein
MGVVLTSLAVLDSVVLMKITLASKQNIRTSQIRMRSLNSDLMGLNVFVSRCRVIPCIFGDAYLLRLTVVSIMHISVVIAPDLLTGNFHKVRIGRLWF